MSNWVGYAISVNCAEPLGCYQGTIVEANSTTITLTKAFRNGFPYPKSHVTLNAADIKDMRILESKPEPSEQTHSTVAVTKSSKKAQRATVCENLQANPTSSTGNQASASNVSGNKSNNNSNRGVSGPPRSKPLDIQGAGRGRARRRDEACFGESASPAALDDFDFEGNLALFDKRALWQRLAAERRPDVVRHAEPACFRHDENVLGGGAAPRRALRVPAAWRARDYVTDEGLVVGAARPELRARLWAGLRARRLLAGARLLLARAAADVALRLVGGGRRLDPRNAHQAPTVVALAGPHGAGAAGLAAARLLASHGARAVALLAAPPPAAPDAALARELAALEGAGVALARSAGALPRPDLVLLALHDPEAREAQEPYAAALAWAGAAGAHAVALEPPPEGWPGVSARAAVHALVPGELPAALGRAYLADVAPPPALLHDHGVHYRPPFGAHSVLPLHPADD